MAPAVAGETVVIGSCGGTIYGLDTADGSVRWKHDTAQDGPSAQFHGEALVRGGTIFIGADGPQTAHLYALDTATGKVRWKRQTGHGVPTRILGFPGSIAFVTGDGILMSVDPEDGSTRWQFASEDRIEGRQLISAMAKGNHIVFHAQDGEVRLFEAGHGKQLWRSDAGSPPSADPLIRDDEIVVATASAELIRINGATGEQIVRMKLDGRIHGALTTDGERILALVGRSGESALVALDSELKEILWERTMTEEWTTYRPFVRDGVVMVGGRDALCSFRTADGTAIDCVGVKGMVRSMARKGDQLFIGTLGGTVYSNPE
jgi:outer membrane protein assembly factor BamB